MAMLRCNVQRSAANCAMQSSQAALHVQSKACQQQLVHDMVVAVARSQVTGRHALRIIA